MRAQFLKPAILVSIYLGLSPWSSAALAQNADASDLYKRGLAATCANCHGTDGKGVVEGGMPLINNLTSEQMLTQLKAFKSGAREGTIMPQLAKGYSDEQLETLYPIATNGRPQQFIRSIEWGTYDGVLSLDGYDMDKLFPTITASVSNKALTSNVATLTTSSAHGFSVGMDVTITGVDATFNGTYRITTVPLSTTFTYAKTATNVTSTAVSPVGTATSNVIHFVDYNNGVDSPVYAMCDDGTTAYWVTNKVSGTNKMTVLSKPLTGDSVTSETTLFTAGVGSTVSNATMEYVKERIVMCANNKVYEFPINATALPTPIYTAPASTHVYTSITASGPAIYIAGYNGIQSTISKFTLTSTGALPTLTSAITAAELPVGEIVHKISYYLGYMMIGTNKGIRAALVNDQDGSLQYGPLIVETSQPCYDFAMRDRFVWCATGVDGEPGVIRLDLGNEVSFLRFAYCNDLYYPGIAGHKTVGCAFIDGTSRLAFVTEAGSGTGANYLQSATDKVASGYLQTGKIRYSTLEGKVFKFLKSRVDNTYGGFVVKSIGTDDVEYSLGSFSEGDFTPEVGISYPIGSQEFLSFKFEMTRSAGTITQGPIFRGYQLKSLPAVGRQRLIQFPVLCYDSETDNYGVSVGYEGRAYDRIKDLELLEEAGDSIRVEDFRTGESFIGLLEEVQFINRTPTDKRFNGFGGILLITVRTL